MKLQTHTSLVSSRWHSAEPHIEEEYSYLFATMTEALDDVNKPPICVEPHPLNSYLSPTSTKQEPLNSSLVIANCNTFSCQKFSPKISAEPEFDCKSS